MLGNLCQSNYILRSHLYFHIPTGSVWSRGHEYFSNLIGRWNTRNNDITRLTRLPGSLRRARAVPQLPGGDSLGPLATAVPLLGSHYSSCSPCSLPMKLPKQIVKRWKRKGALYRILRMLALQSRVSHVPATVSLG